MNIFGVEVEIPDSLARYFALKRSFRELADLTYESAVKRFSDDDMTTAYGMTDDGSISDGFTNWGRRFARHSLQNIVDLGVGSLTEEDRFTVDAAAYESDYLDTSAIDAFLESGTTITRIRELEDEENARESKRQGRSRRARNMWVGGTLGGGITGALRGALKAEVMNMGGGLLSDAANKFGRDRSCSQMLSKIVRIFPVFRLELAEAIRAAVQDNLDGFVQCLNDHLGKGICGTWSRLDEKTACGILGNLKSGRVSSGRLRDSIARMIRLDPFSADAYDWVYRNVESARSEVKELSAYFCVPVEAIEEEAAEQRRKEEEEKQRKRAEERKAQEADKARRTAFGKVWPSIAEMTRARADKRVFLERVEELVSHYNGQDGTVGTELMGKKLTKVQVVFDMLPGERVLWLLDTSTWYNANYGLIVTDLGFRWKNRDASVSKVRCLNWKRFGESAKPPRMLKNSFLRLSKGALVDMDVNAQWVEKWLPILEQLYAYWNEGTFVKEDCAMEHPLRMEASPDVKCVSPSDGSTNLPSDGQTQGLDAAQSIVDVIRKAVADIGGGLYCVPDIPEKKMINAKIAMSVPQGETVVALMDTTFFGSAKTGAVLTDWGVRWKNDWTTDSQKTALSWKELRDCCPCSVSDYNLTLTEGAVIGTAGGGISAANLSKVIDRVSSFEKGCS